MKRKSKATTPLAGLRDGGWVLRWDTEEGTKEERAESLGGARAALLAMGERGWDGPSKDSARSKVSGRYEGRVPLSDDYIRRTILDPGMSFGLWSRIAALELLDGKAPSEVSKKEVLEKTWPLHALLWEMSKSSSDMGGLEVEGMGVPCDPRPTGDVLAEHVWWHARERDLPGALMARVLELAHSESSGSMDPLGYQPLDMAAALNCGLFDESAGARLIDKLIDNGGDVNRRNPDGRTPIMVAALNRNFEICAALARRGSDPEVRLRGGDGGTDISVMDFITREAPNEAKSVRSAWEGWLLSREAAPGVSARRRRI